MVPGLPGDCPALPPPPQPAFIKGVSAFGTSSYLCTPPAVAKISLGRQHSATSESHPSLCGFESDQSIFESLDGREERKEPLEILYQQNLGLKQAIQQAVKPLERRMILQALEANGWHRGLAARQLRISYGALLYKMKETGLTLERSTRPTGPIN